MTDRFETYDAPYVLGALPPGDRAAFEEHLDACGDCRHRVEAIAGLPGLLAGVDRGIVATLGREDPPVPSTLLPRLLHQVERARFRRRVMTTVAGLVAAAVLALALVVGLRPDDAVQQPVATGPGISRSMTPVTREVPIRATARLSSQSWGTRIVIRCVYREPAGSGYRQGPLYTMVVTDRSGGTQQIAAWEAHQGAPIVVDGSTSVPRSEITSVQVRDESDRPVLTLRL